MSGPFCFNRLPAQTEKTFSALRRLRGWRYSKGFIKPSQAATVIIKVGGYKNLSLSETARFGTVSVGVQGVKPLGGVLITNRFGVVIG